MTQFKQQLVEFRERAKVTKRDLAAYIGKSESYIYKLETGYTPPLFEICQKMSQCLRLSTQETKDFLTTAFVERCENDGEFVEFLEIGMRQIPAQSVETPKRQPAAVDMSLTCQYYVRLYTKFQQPFIKGDIAASLETVLQDTLRSSGSILAQLSFNSTSASFMLSINPEHSVTTFINGLKSHTSGVLRNDYPELRDYPSLWDNDHQISTVGPMPQLTAIPGATYTGILSHEFLT